MTLPGREAPPSERVTDEPVVLPPVGVMRGERDLGATFFSDAALAILGLSADAARGNGWLDALDPNDIETVLGALDRAVRG
ncbi:MAG: hypothetical protein QOI55_1355, partial [Actinomycetota bacterium]|nr:hypothetical protein [Actinomycetota bacterium]